MSYSDTHQWENEVRDYELDAQGIVNNAVYLNYFEHARHIFFKDCGFDVITLHEQGFDLVAIRIEIDYHASLKSGDAFYITTIFKKISRLKFSVNQILYLKQDDKKVASASTIATCIDAKTRRPVWPDELSCFL